MFSRRIKMHVKPFRPVSQVSLFLPSLDFRNQVIYKLFLNDYLDCLTYGELTLGADGNLLACVAAVSFPTFPQFFALPRRAPPSLSRLICPPKGNGCYAGYEWKLCWTCLVSGHFSDNFEGCTQIFRNFLTEFPSRLVIFPKFPQCSVECFGFPRFDNFRTYWEITLTHKISVPFALVSKCFE